MYRVKFNTDSAFFDVYVNGEMLASFRDEPDAHDWVEHHRSRGW